jgi:hypothetical protein
VQLFHTKVLYAAFMCLQFGFLIFWRQDFGAKAAHKMLVKLTPGEYSKKYATIADYIEGKWAKEYRFYRGLYTWNIPV